MLLIRLKVDAANLHRLKAKQLALSTEIRNCPGCSSGLIIHLLIGHRFLSIAGVFEAVGSTALAMTTARR